MLSGMLSAAFPMQISQMIQYIFKSVAIERHVLANHLNTWRNQLFSGEIIILKTANRTQIPYIHPNLHV